MRELLTFIYGLLIIIIGLILLIFAGQYFLNEKYFTSILDGLIGGMVLWAGINKIERVTL